MYHKKNEGPENRLNEKVLHPVPEENGHFFTYETASQPSAVGKKGDGKMNGEMLRQIVSYRLTAITFGKREIAESGSKSIKEAGVVIHLPLISI